MRKIHPTGVKSPALCGCMFPFLLLVCAMVQANEPLSLDGDPLAGQPLYQTHCADCHGERAQGDGPWAGVFDAPPPNLARDDLSAKRLFLATRDGGMAVGMRGTMPAFGHLLDEQSIHDLVAYIQSLSD